MVPSRHRPDCSCLSQTSLGPRLLAKSLEQGTQKATFIPQIIQWQLLE